MAGTDLGKRIRYVRKKLGMTQDKFGTQLGVTKLSVARYESGRLPRVDVLDRIARHAGVSLNWLLHGSDTDPPYVPKLSSTETLVTAISPESFSRVALLPVDYRKRYEKWSKELLRRLRQDLEEYAQLLEGQFKRHIRRKPSKVASPGPTTTVRKLSR